MERKAVNQAEGRLKRAVTAISRIEQARSYEAFEQAWSDFLSAYTGVYAKLSIGAKPNGRSNAWFGRMIHFRKNDPLLSYLHHARDVDYHGIEQVTEFKKGKMLFTGDAEYNGRLGPGGVLTVTPLGGSKPKLTIKPGSAKLVPVIDERHNVVFQPPQEHLGQPINISAPIDAAKLAVPYLRSLIDEASSFVT